MKLYISGKLAVKEQEVETFRGEKGILKGWREPHKPSSTGRVYVILDNDKAWGENEWFPSVINGEFKDE